MRTCWLSLLLLAACSLKGPTYEMRLPEQHSSLTNGMRGFVGRHEGSSKAILAKSGTARSNSSFEIPRSAIERGIASWSSNCSVAATRLFTFSAIV